MKSETLADLEGRIKYEVYKINDLSIEMVRIEEKVEKKRV